MGAYRKRCLASNLLDRRLGETLLGKDSTSRALNAATAGVALLLLAFLSGGHGADLL